MAKLPILSGAQVVGAFATLGWSVARQRGSHVIMVKEGETATLSVPDHREVARGTLRSLIRMCHASPSMNPAAVLDLYFHGFTQSPQLSRYCLYAAHCSAFCSSQVLTSATIACSASIVSCPMSTRERKKTK